MKTTLKTMHTLAAMRSGYPYVLMADIREKKLTDAQVAGAIAAARRGEGERVTTSDGSIESYVEIDGVTVPVLGV